ncbi:MAG: hypothetical protein Q9162_001551 [Coniocarpon cinnabarinum]
MDLAAIVIHPPMGRAKYKLYQDDPKAKGRNELIAQYLLDVLGDEFVLLMQRSKTKSEKEGEIMPRKVVSSHVQVLKQKFAVKKLDSVSKYCVERRAKADHMPVFDMLGGNSEKDEKERKKAARSPTKLQERQRAQLEPAAVDMALQIGDLGERLYSFARADPISPAADDLDLKYREDWQIEFPALADLYNARRPEGDVFLMESTLNVPLERPSTMNTQDTKLTIENRFKIAKTILRPDLDVRSLIRTSFTFYIDGRADESFTSVPIISQHDPSMCVVPLGSPHWVKLLSRVWSINSENRRTFNMRYHTADDSKLIAEMHDLVRNTLRSITIVQEVNMTDIAQEDGDAAHSVPPLLTMCWKFDVTSCNEPGRATYRRVILPPNEMQQSEAGSKLDWYWNLDCADQLLEEYPSYGNECDTKVYAPFAYSYDIDDSKEAHDQYLTATEGSRPWQLLEHGPEGFMGEQTNSGLAENHDIDTGGLVAFDPAIVTDGQARQGVPTMAITDTLPEGRYLGAGGASSYQSFLSSAAYDIGDCLPGSSTSIVQQLPRHPQSQYATISDLRTTLQHSDMPSQQDLPLRPASGSHRDDCASTTALHFTDAYTGHENSVRPAVSDRNYDASNCQIPSMVQSASLPGLQQHSIANGESQLYRDDMLYQMTQTLPHHAAQQASQAYQQFISMPNVAPADLDTTFHSPRPAPTPINAQPVHQHRYETRHKQRTQPVLPSQALPKATPEPSSKILQPMPHRSESHSLAQRRASHATTISTAQPSWFEDVISAPTTAATESFDIVSHGQASSQNPSEVAPCSTRSSPCRPSAVLAGQTAAMANPQAPRSASAEFHHQTSRSDTVDAREYLEKPDDDPDVAAYEPGHDPSNELEQYRSQSQQPLNKETEFYGTSDHTQAFNSDCLGLVFDPAVLAPLEHTGASVHDSPICNTYPSTTFDEYQAEGVRTYDASVDSAFADPYNIPNLKANVETQPYNDFVEQQSQSPQHIDPTLIHSTSHASPIDDLPSIFHGSAANAHSTIDQADEPGDHTAQASHTPSHSEHVITFANMNQKPAATQCASERPTKRRRARTKSGDSEDDPPLWAEGTPDVSFEEMHDDALLDALGSRAATQGNQPHGEGKSKQELDDGSGGNSIKTTQGDGAMPYAGDDAKTNGVEVMDGTGAGADERAIKTEEEEWVVVGASQ